MPLRKSWKKWENSIVDSTAQLSRESLNEALLSGQLVQKKLADVDDVGEQWRAGDELHHHLQRNIQKKKVTDQLMSRTRRADSFRETINKTNFDVGHHLDGTDAADCNFYRRWNDPARLQHFNIPQKSKLLKNFKTQKSKFLKNQNSSKIKILQKFQNS